MTTSDPLLDAYLANRSRFVSWVAGMVGCPAHAEDIVQEAFIHINAAARRAVVVFSPLAYLTTTVRRVALDHLKSAQQRQIPTEIDHALLSEGGAVSPTPEAWFRQREELDHVDAVLATLPSRTRGAFEMYRGERYTLQEIACALDISTARVYTMVQSALAACAAAFPDQEP